MSRRASRIVNILFLVAGIGLLVGLVMQFDMDELAAHFARAGWMFVPSFLAYVGNLAASSGAWWQCFEGRKSTPPFLLLFGVFWSGHAINAVSPGKSGGEVLRSTLLSRRARSEEVVASLVVYSYLNLVVTLGLVVAGPAFCMFWLDLPRDVITTLFGTSLVLVVFVVGVRWLLHHGLVERISGLLLRLPFVRTDPDRLRERAAWVDDHVKGYRHRRPAAFVRALLFCSLARVFQVAAFWFFLIPLLPDEAAWTTFLLALLTRSAAQLINWAGIIVPGRVGVTEGGIALLFELIGLGAAVGLSLALLNRARLMVGIAVGLVIGTVLEARLRPNAPSSDATDTPDAADSSGEP